MSRHYDDPIEVTLAADGTPSRLIWRQTTYRVRQVFARWHLRDRWWAATQGPADESAPKGVPPQSPPARARDRAAATHATVSPSPHNPRGEAGLATTPPANAISPSLSPRDVGAGHVPPVGPGGEDTSSTSTSSAPSAPSAPSAVPSFSSPTSVPSVVNPSASAIPSDRYYYRLSCTPPLICDVYWDAATAAWRLEYLHD